MKKQFTKIPVHVMDGTEKVQKWVDSLVDANEICSIRPDKVPVYEQFDHRKHSQKNPPKIKEFEDVCVLNFKNGADLCTKGSLEQVQAVLGA